MHWCSKQMQQMYLDNRMEDMVELYPLLIETVHEFKVCLAQLLDKRKFLFCLSSLYVESSDPSKPPSLVSQTPLSDLYTLTPQGNLYICHLKT